MSTLRRFGSHFQYASRGHHRVSWVCMKLRKQQCAWGRIAELVTAGCGRERRKDMKLVHLLTGAAVAVVAAAVVFNFNDIRRYIRISTM
jgi:hypothetical protein